MRDEMNEEITLHIIRAPHDKEHPYVSIDNRVFDSGLSISAIGLLYLILVNNDNAHFAREDLFKHSGVSRPEFEEACQELEVFGYLIPTPREQV